MSDNIPNPHPAEPLPPGVEEAFRALHRTLSGGRRTVSFRENRARTHIKAVMQEIKNNDGHKAAQPAGLFMSGMLTGLASGIEILDGGTAEKALETVGMRLAAAIGDAFLAGNLPAQPPAKATEAATEATESGWVCGENEGCDGGCCKRADMADAVTAQAKQLMDRRTKTLRERAERAEAAVAELAQAIRLTREYVGEEVLPPVEGWSWYDALRRHAPHELPTSCQPEPSDPAQCSGDAGPCPEHGHHEESLKQPAPEAAVAEANEPVSSPLYEEIVASLANFPIAAWTPENLTRRVLQVVLPHGKFLGDQLRDAEEQLLEARQWARHGYEIGQRHCSWSDHGVAPAWLTEGWPPHIDSCEHLQLAAQYDEALTRVRDALRTTFLTGPNAISVVRASAIQEALALPEVVHPKPNPQATAASQLDDPCLQHPDAPMIGGVCGVCTPYRPT